MNTETMPVKPDTISELEARYKQALQHLNKAGEHVKKALQELPAPKYGKGFARTEASSLANTGTIQTVSNNFKADAWRYVFETTEITRFMCADDIEKMRKQLDDGEKLPDFTTENVPSVMTANLGNIDDYINKLAHAVFKTLTPWRGYDDQYKTNHNPGIGKKYIWCYLISNWCGLSLNYRQHDSLNEIQKLFLLLDGEPSTDYTWSQAIDKELRDGAKTYENEYIKIKAFKNGNGHLEFKRMDLIDRINAMVCGAALPHNKKTAA